MRLLLGYIFLLISINVYADDCLVSDVRTKEEVNAVQDCMIQQLTELDNLLGGIREYHVRVNSQLASLIKEDAICKDMELVAKANLSSQAYQALVDECNVNLAERQSRYMYVVDEYQKMEPRMKELEAQKKKIEAEKQELDVLYRKLPSS